MSLLDRVQKGQGPDPLAPPEGAYVPQAGGTPGTRQSSASTRVRTSFEVQAERIKNRLQARLIENIDEGEDEDREQRAARITDALNAVLAEMGLSLTKPEKQRLLDSVLNDFLGLGPIEALISDPTITEIMVNGPDQIFVEHKGKLTLSNVQFESEDQLRRVIDRIVSTIGRRIDEGSPMVDARLKDGSRVNVIIPPLALNGPILTIRKFSKDPYKITDLIKFGTITDPMAQFVRACVRSRLNMLVSGGTGSGKTTTLNVLSSFIPEEERVVTVEDAAELQLNQEHVVTLESRPATVEGRGRIAIRDLVVNALRMRPDRIVVGECRGGEALDMLQAMNTGHEGSMSTVHANTAADALSRLETMVLMAGAELPMPAIRKQVAAAVDLIVQMQRLRGQLDVAFQGVTDRLNQRERRRGRPTLEERLARAGLRFRPSEYMAAQAGCAGLLGLLAFLRFGIGPAVPVAAVLGLVAPGLF